MADIALTTADRVEIVGFPVRQSTKVAGEDITAGAPIVQNTSGKWVNTDANGTTSLLAVDAIATRTVKSGMSLTGIAEGRLDGFVFTDQAYGATIFASNTVGRLADAAGSTSMVVGYVEAATGNPITASHDKILNVNIPNRTS